MLKQVIRRHTGVYPLVHRDIDRHNNNRRVTIGNIKVLNRDVFIDASDDLQYTDITALSKDSQNEILTNFPQAVHFRLYLFKTPIPYPEHSCMVWGFFYLDNRVSTI